MAYSTALNAEFRMEVQLSHLGLSSNAGINTKGHIIKCQPSVAHIRHCWPKAAPDCCIASTATCHWQDNRPEAWTAVWLN